MQEFLKRCAAVLGRVLFIGFGIQIVLGVLWMCNAFAGMSSFGEGIVCVGQILLLGGAVWFAGTGAVPSDGVSPDEMAAGRVVSGGVPSGRELFSISAVLSFPMVMQCLMKPDLRVVMTAFLLLAFGCILRYGRGKREGRSGFTKRMLAAACVFLLSGIVTGAIREPHTDLLMRMGSRMVWTTLYKEYERLPKETRDKIDYHYDELAESTYEATGIENVFLPSMESTMGRQESREVLKEMIALSWEYSKGRILKEIIWDEAGYLMAPLILPLQLKGRAYESYSGLNYRQVLQPAPKLGSLYMRYSCCWFAAAMVLRGLLWLMGERRIAKRTCCYAAVTALFMSLWYTMSGAGKMDYKNTVYILCIWLIWMTCVSFTKRMAEERTENTEDTEQPADKEVQPYEKER